MLPPIIILKFWGEVWCAKCLVENTDRQLLPEDNHAACQIISNIYIYIYLIIPNNIKWYQLMGGLSILNLNKWAPKPFILCEWSFGMFSSATVAFTGGGMGRRHYSRTSGVWELMVGFIQGVQGVHWWQKGIGVTLWNTTEINLALNRDFLKMDIEHIESSVSK